MARLVVFLTAPAAKAPGAHKEMVINTARSIAAALRTEDDPARFVLLISALPHDIIVYIISNEILPLKNTTVHII
jgi:hypothetical protein